MLLSPRFLVDGTPVKLWPECGSIIPLGRQCSRAEPGPKAQQDLAQWVLLAEEMKNGRGPEKALEDLSLEQLLFNSPCFLIIRTNSLLAQFPFPKVGGMQETSPKMLSVLLSLTV